MRRGLWHFWQGYRNAPWPLRARLWLSLYGVLAGAVLALGGAALLFVHRHDARVPVPRWMAALSLSVVVTVPTEWALRRRGDGGGSAAP